MHLKDKITKRCPICGRSFQTTLLKNRQKYCSDKCRNSIQKHMVDSYVKKYNKQPTILELKQYESYYKQSLISEKDENEM